MNREHRLWFLLGREPLLSAAEIFAVLGEVPHTYAAPFLSLSTSTDPAELMPRLGGTIKIAKELSLSLDEDDLMDVILKELKTVSGKIEFGLSVHANTELKTVERWGKKIKQTLKDAGFSARFVFNDEIVLSSVSVEKNNLIKKGREFLISQNESGLFAAAITKAVQPFEAFGARDFGRPGRDDVSGMLPPKLALMMLNLAQAPTSATVLDPFCGSGTVLNEALLQGYTHLVGSDLSERAVADSTANIAWQEKDAEKSSAHVKIFQADVRELGAKIPPRSVSAIVTEPYLGPPLRGHETPEQIKKNVSELAELYIKAFSQFKLILAPKSTVVFIIPRFTIQDVRYTISDKIIPELKKLGFEKKRLLPTALDPASYVLYQRPGQRVGREVWRFELNG